MTLSSSIFVCSRHNGIVRMRPLRLSFPPERKASFFFRMGNITEASILFQQTSSLLAGAGAGAGGRRLREDAGTREGAGGEEGEAGGRRAGGGAGPGGGGSSHSLKSRPGPSVRQARDGGAGGPATSRHPRPDPRPRRPARARGAAAQRPRPAGKGAGRRVPRGWGVGAGRGGGRPRPRRPCEPPRAQSSDLPNPQAVPGRGRSTGPRVRKDPVTRRLASRLSSLSSS